MRKKPHLSVWNSQQSQEQVGTGCPERWEMSHPWKHSRPGWTGLWATWSSWRCPCSLQGHWTRWSLKVASNSKHSVSLWVYDSMILSFGFSWPNSALAQLGGTIDLGHSSKGVCTGGARCKHVGTGKWECTFWPQGQIFCPGLLYAVVWRDREMPSEARGWPWFPRNASHQESAIFSYSSEQCGCFETQVRTGSAVNKRE